MDAKLIARFDTLPQDWRRAIEDVLRKCIESAETTVRDGPPRCAELHPSHQSPEIAYPYPAP